MISVLVMQCVLLGFAQTAQIREFKPCLERVNHLISLLQSVSDFNPVFFAIFIANFIAAMAWAVAHATVLSPHSRHPGFIAERTNPGISPRRALAHDAGFDIRCVR